MLTTNLWLVSFYSSQWTGEKTECIHFLLQLEQRSTNYRASDNTHLLPYSPVTVEEDLFPRFARFWSLSTFHSLCPLPHLRGWHGSISDYPVSQLSHSTTYILKHQFSPPRGKCSPCWECTVYTDRNNGAEVETDCFSFFQSSEVSFPLLCSSHTVWVPPIQGLNFDHRNWCWEDINWTLNKWVFIITWLLFLQ